MPQKHTNKKTAKVVPIGVDKEEGDAIAIEKIVAALVKHNGLQYLAAQELGVTRKTLYSYRKQWPVIEELTQEFKGVMIDKAERSLLDGVEKCESWAVMFVLNCLGRDRGYGLQSKVEVTGANGQPLLDPLAAALDKAYGHSNEAKADESSDGMRDAGE